MSVKILIVDDEPFNVDLLEQELEDQGYETCMALNGADALVALDREKPDIVLLDWMMPGMNGIAVLEKMRGETRWQAVPVIMVTARSTTEDLVQGLDAGADDYVTKPIDNAELFARIRAMLRIARLERENSTLSEENTSLRQQLEEGAGYQGVVGKSVAMQRVYALVKKVVDSDATVLVQGETGTGKEVLARTVHREGPRAEKPFITINCGAMAENLLESELFGHKKGAFTGAVNDRAGLFEAADGGTLFLDEIGETSLSMQVRLLRAIQEGEIRRVGEERDRQVDVRVIAATHRDLEQCVREGQFREDLYYRLSVFPISLPPLRERREDIPLLAQHFLERQTSPQAPRSLTTRAMDALCAHVWPGNIRELQNEVERAALLAGGEERIDTAHLSERITGPAGSLTQIDRSGQLKEVLAQVERDMIVRALQRSNGNRTRAARELGVSRWGMVQKIKLYAIEE
jgi:DNA-binding NtrC family response regulator